MSNAQTPAPRGQSDHDKLRRLPFLYASTVMTGTAVLCTVQAPLTLFAAELGLGEDRIGLLGGMMPFFQVLGIAALPVIQRFGSRRIAGSALALRYAFLTLFLVAPLFVDRPDLVFAVLMTAMLGFAVLRSVAEAAFVPWSQEFMPRAVRGRIAGRMALAYVPVALVVSWFIQLWLDGRSGLARFYPVFVAGIAIGVTGALLLFVLRGGAPVVATGRRGLRSLAEPLRDRNFLVFLVASALLNLVTVAVGLFMILFFRDRLGMSSGALVLTSAFVPVGSAAGNLVAGWFVDRYGTRAIRMALQAGQVLLLVSLPLVGPGSGGADVIVAAAFFAFGFLFYAGIAVGNVYMLNTVPPASKESYMALHYSVDGLMAGAVTFAAGFLLIWIGDRPLQILGLTPDKYDVLFILAAVLAAGSALAFAILREDGAISMRDFLGHISTGSPLRALWGISRYNSLTSEDRRRDLAYGFGSTGSPLAKEELIAALRDPSFDVRHEAIRALGHIGPHREVVRALEAVLDQDGLIELQYAALGSLGRLRARGSAPRIALFLDDANPLLRARAARSLGDLREGQSLPRIRAMLAGDVEPDCRLAAASALGKLRDRASIGPLLALYVGQARDAAPAAEPRSMVVLLALAKILDVEEGFSQAWRREERHPGIALPGLLLRLAAVARPQAPAAAEGLRALAATWDGGDDAGALALMLALRPALHDLAHPDAAPMAALLDGLHGIDRPHPALLIFLAIGLRRVFRG